ncbi:MAG: tetratricopeptide repeat protein [Gallionellaceae bacterium]
MIKYLLFCITLIFLLASCMVPTEQGNRFQVSTAKTSSTTGPVAELHRNAIAALDSENSKQAIEYLQRAIKIEPRNPLSWHYLAQSYWQRGNFTKCLAMIERSYSYSRPVDDLDDGNEALKQKCL